MCLFATLAFQNPESQIAKSNPALAQRLASDEAIKFEA
jgi:hypothetical protein